MTDEAAASTTAAANQIPVNPKSGQNMKEGPATTNSANPQEAAQAPSNVPKGVHSKDQIRTGKSILFNVVMKYFKNGNEWLNLHGPKKQNDPGDDEYQALLNKIMENLPEFKNARRDGRAIANWDDKDWNPFIEIAEEHIKLSRK